MRMTHTRCGAAMSSSWPSIAARPAALASASRCGQDPRRSRDSTPALTELLDGDSHRFLVEVGSEAGAELLAQLPHEPASDEQRTAAEAVVARAAGQMGRSLDTAGIKRAPAEQCRSSALG